MIWDGIRVGRATMEPGLAGVDVTVREMARRIKRNTRDPLVRRAAIDALRGTPEYSALPQAKAVYGWVRDQIRYQRDPKGLEWIQSAPRTLEIGAGDCDCQAILVGSLLGAGGVQGETRLSVVAVEPSRKPGHIFLEWRDPKSGQWHALDSSWRGAGARFGWQPRWSRKIVYALPEGSRIGEIMASGSSGGQVASGLGGFGEFFSSISTVLTPLAKTAGEIYSAREQRKTAQILQRGPVQIPQLPDIFKQAIPPQTAPGQRPVPPSVIRQPQARIPMVTEQGAIWWGETPGPKPAPKPAPAKTAIPAGLIVGGLALLLFMGRR